MDIVRGKASWIHITAPDSKDIEWLKDEFNLHPVILDELRNFSARTHVESFGDYLYVVYQFPVYDVDEKISRRGEIDFVITKKAVISVSYELIEPLEEFKKVLKISKEIKSKAFQDSLQLIYHILSEMLSYNQRQLRHIHDKVEKIGLQMFKDREEGLLKKIAYLKRDISEYKIIISPQGQLLQSLVARGTQFWGPQASVYLNDVMGDYSRIINRVDDYKQAVTDFQETNTQILNLKSVKVMKTFTILSFLTLPWVPLVAIFSMPAESNPILKMHGGFWVVLGVVTVGVMVMISYFRKKNWL